MSIIINIIYLLFCMYSIYTITDAGINYIKSPKIYYTTEYDLHDILSNSSDQICKTTHNVPNTIINNSLEHVLIDRTTNNGVFKVNQTYCLNGTLTSSIIHYGLLLSPNDMTNTLNRLTGRITNRTNIRIEYHDKQDTILDMFTLKTLVYYFIVFMIVRFLLSLIVTQQTGPIEKMLGDIDMTIAVDTVSTKFTDIVGIVEAKQQIMKYVDIIKNREKYSLIGATIPKGVLLCGPPGCGKTLLAKAVAGEAGVKFISVCGSDFDEVFVGVGSSRVKKLFELAKKSTPCIIFIDEIDSIGEKRNSKLNQGVGTETLNKILAEMDGFKSVDNIMVLASTNRESHLDPALLRSGRFDSKIYVDPPNRKEREDLYKLYLNKVKLDESLSTLNIDDLANKLSKMSPSTTGADIKNICNQAAINAVADSRTSIIEIDLCRAIDDIIIGIEKKTKQGNSNELEVTAYHEAGHALIGYLVKNAMPPMKVSIIPRGHGIAGYTLPEEQESNNRSREDLIAEVYTLLGGRCAEIIKFNKITTGASNDFEKATKIIELMITSYGMYEKYCPMIFDLSRNSPNCVSDKIRTEIEITIRSELQNIYKNVSLILKTHFTQLDQLSQKLLEHEIIDYAQIKEMFPDLESTVDIL